MSAKTLARRKKSAPHPGEGSLPPLVEEVSKNFLIEYRSYHQNCLKGPQRWLSLTLAYLWETRLILKEISGFVKLLSLSTSFLLVISSMILSFFFHDANVTMYLRQVKARQLTVFF